MRPVVSVQSLPRRLQPGASVRGQSGFWLLRSCAQCGPNVAHVNRTSRRATQAPDTQGRLQPFHAHVLVAHHALGIVRLERERAFTELALKILSWLRAGRL